MKKRRKPLSQDTKHTLAIAAIMILPFAAVFGIRPVALSLLLSISLIALSAAIGILLGYPVSVIYHCYTDDIGSIWHNLDPKTYVKCLISTFQENGACNK